MEHLHGENWWSTRLEGMSVLLNSRERFLFYQEEAQLSVNLITVVFSAAVNSLAV